eukprot:gene5000-9188_t
MKKKKGLKALDAPGLSKDELVSRLKDTVASLEGLANEEHTTETNKIAAALMKKELMKSKDKDVRMWTACCLAEAMRIYAPSAPFSNTELKSILNLFVSQLQYISKINTPNFKRYYALLDAEKDRIAEVDKWNTVHRAEQEAEAVREAAAVKEALFKKHEEALANHRAKQALVLPALKHLSAKQKADYENARRERQEAQLLRQAREEETYASIVAREFRLPRHLVSP